VRLYGDDLSGVLREEESAGRCWDFPAMRGLLPADEFLTSGQHDFKVVDSFFLVEMGPGCWTYGKITRIERERKVIFGAGANCPAKIVVETVGPRPVRYEVPWHTVRAIFAVRACRGLG